MSKSMILALVLAMAVAVLSAPSEEKLGERDLPEELDVPAANPEESADAVRQARITCDLLSGIGWNHSFCAMHCLLLGYRGGACNSAGVCVCRR